MPRFWNAFFRAVYSLPALLDPALRAWWQAWATTQRPFPGNLIYGLGWRHVRRVGISFRLVALDEQVL